MTEKILGPGAKWQAVDDSIARKALATLFEQSPVARRDATLIHARGSEFAFYKEHFLLEVIFSLRDESFRTFFLYGEKSLWRLDGTSAPIHAANEAESVTLTETTAADY